MLSFIIPKKLNGKQLKNELIADGIDIDDFPTIKDDLLWLNIDVKFEEKAKNIVDSHVGIDEPNYKQSALAKLAALGLTPEEIAAL